MKQLDAIDVLFGPDPNLAEPLSDTDSEVDWCVLEHDVELPVPELRAGEFSHEGAG
jgi:hypothetical protein